MTFGTLGEILKGAIWKSGVPRYSSDGGGALLPPPPAKSEAIVLVVVFVQNSEEYNNKGGCKNKKVSAGAPSLGEVSPHHMRLASHSARVFAAERWKDEK